MCVRVAPMNSLPRVRDEGDEWVALGSRLDGQSHRTTQRRKMGIERGLKGFTGGLGKQVRMAESKAGLCCRAGLMY